MADNDRFFESTFAGKRALVLKQNAEAYKKYYAEEAAYLQAALDEKEAAVAESERRIKKLKAAGRTAELAEEQAKYKQYLDEQINLERSAQNAIEEAKAKARQKAQIEEEQAFTKMSRAQRREYSKNIAEQLKDEIKLKEAKAALMNKDTPQEQEEYDKLQKEIAKAKQRQQNAEQFANTFSIQSLVSDPESRKQFITNKREAAVKEEKEANSKLLLAKSNTEAAQAKFNDKFKEKELEWQKRINKAKEDGNKAELEAIETERANEIAASEEYKALQQAKAEEEKATNNAVSAAFKTAALKNIEGLNGAVAKIISQVNSNNIDNILDDVFGSRARMMGRLQGSKKANGKDYDWGDAVDGVSDAIGFSGIVRKRDVVKQMEKLVDSGVAYNLELRAFIAQTSESIASTFSAFDSSLLRIIKLQQADTTAARLGMEASLTKLFNEYFQDTSYLSSDVADTVRGNLIDSIVTMDKDQALQYEFTVQKWLGSLYSLGMTDTAVQKIATGLNYLGTGNITALNNDSSLQTLFSMSATKAGKSYANLLTGGLTSDDTNDLLKAMIEYLAEIADSQQNMVTKSAYAELFGMSITDLSTFASLKNEEITNIYKTSQNYQSLVNETQDQLKQIWSRTNINTLVDNIIDNALVGVASTIGSNGITYGTWKAIGLLQEYVGSINIPGITAFGTGITSNIDILNVAKTAMMGFGMIGSLVGALSSLADGGPSNLDAWDFSETTRRGGGLKLLQIGSNQDTSYSAVLGVGSASGDDVAAVSMESATESAYENGGVTSEEMEENKEFPEKILEAINGEQEDSLVNILTSINDRLDPQRVFYTAITGTLTSDAVARATNLSAQLATASTAVARSVGEETTSSSQSQLTLDNALRHQTTITPEMLEEIITEGIRAYYMSLATANTLYGGQTL